MTTQHPITPPPELSAKRYLNTPPAELFTKCYEQAEYQLRREFSLKFVVSHAIRTSYDAGHAAGADQELKECCKAVTDQIITIDNIGLSGPAGVLHTEGFSSWPAFAQMVSRQLRAARRPKPPSLKEQGREALERISNSVVMATGGAELDVLKAIVEQLPD
jgi:hypothetical protein